LLLLLLLLSLLLLCCESLNVEMEADVDKNNIDNNNNKQYLSEYSQSPQILNRQDYK